MELHHQPEQISLKIKKGYLWTSPKDVLDSSLAYSSPHVLTGYLMDLAGKFHKFYDHHRVLESEPKTRSARLLLLSATQIVVRLGLELLGVSAPQKM